MVAINDRVKETTTSTGTGTINLAGAAVGFESFVAGIGNGNVTYYCIAEQGAANFEIGVGTVTDATPDTLSRTTVLSSSNSDSLVNFGAGTKDVFCTLPASKAIIEDSNNNVNVGANILVGGTVDGVDIATRDGVLTSTTTTANAALPKAGGTMTGNIAHASDFTIDAGGTIKLDADSGNINFQDGGVTFGSFIQSSGNFEIHTSGSDNDIVFKGSDGGSSITALTLDMSSEGSLVVNSNVKYPDSGKAIFGAGTDLAIYHDGNHSYIEDTGTGNLRVRTNNLEVQSGNGNNTLINAVDGGAVELYHNNSKKAETVAGGLTVTGTLTATTLAGSFPYGSLTGAPTIPSNNNQLTNGAGYVTSSGVTSVATGNGLSGGTITSTGTLTMSGSYSGSFSASSNITAYSSDERLKDFKGKIDNALDKVDELNGYYFEWNDVAKGLDGGRSFKEGMEVGVSAQEIEKVLPEVVTEAPIVKIENLDVDYKTVYYDKIVPLLIEAIKELRAEVKELKKDR